MIQTPNRSFPAPDVSAADMIRFFACMIQSRLMDADQAFMDRFIDQKLPWELLYRWAEIEGVAGFLSCYIDSLPKYLVPEAVARRIREHYRNNSLKTLSAIIDLKLLAGGFEKKGIPVMVLQGLSLYSVYKDPGLRPFVDMDLLVHAEDQKAMVKILNDNGYHFASPLYGNLFRKHDRYIDVHTHILDVSRIETRRYLFSEDLAPLWERAVPLFHDIQGIYRLDPYDNFVALSVHALKHSYTRLIWLNDLREILASQPDEPRFWAQLVDRAQFWQQEKVVCYALELLRQLFRTNIPYSVTSSLSKGKLGTLEKYLIRQQVMGFRSSSTCIILWMHNIKGLRKKTKFLWETLFPRDEVMQQIYPESSSWKRKALILRRILDSGRMLFFLLQQMLMTSVKPEKKRSYLARNQ